MSVRRVAAPGRTADVVGDLLDLDAERALIETRQGPVGVALDAITHARLVPASAADILALEAVAARALRPAESALLDGWLLRADHGFTNRANSVLPAQANTTSLDEVLATARAWYAARGLPLQVQLPLGARRQLDADLAALGWPASERTRVYARRLPRCAPEPEVDLADTPSDQWLGLYRGGHALAATGRALLARHDLVAFAALRRGGRTVAVGRGTVDDGWLGVMAVEVDPEHRRQGLARLLMRALSAWAGTHGATRTYLQVLAGNARAIALYESLGYWHHHDYHYRREP